MHGAQNLLDRIEEIGDLNWKWKTQAEADLVLKEIRLVQKQLRLIKRDINSDMTDIRRVYKQKSDAAQSTAGAAFASAFLKRKSIARDSRAEARRRIKVERDSLLKPYEKMKGFVDDLLVELDGAKLKVDQWKHENTEANGE